MSGRSQSERRNGVREETRCGRYQPNRTSLAAPSVRSTLTVARRRFSALPMVDAGRAAVSGRVAWPDGLISSLWNDSANSRRGPPAPRGACRNLSSADVRAARDGRMTSLSVGDWDFMRPHFYVWPRQCRFGRAQLPDNAGTEKLGDRPLVSPSVASRPEEFHLRPLTERCGSLSAHTAPTKQPVGIRAVQ